MPKTDDIDLQNVAKMEAKMVKNDDQNRTKIPVDFFLQFYSLPATFGLPKWSFFGDFFRQKPMLHEKS